jgi:hypothetical protein
MSDMIVHPGDSVSLTLISLGGDSFSYHITDPAASGSHSISGKYTLSAIDHWACTNGTNGEGIYVDICNNGGRAEWYV